MSVHSYYTCDYCNPEMSFDADEGASVSVGFEPPYGWWEVPGVGPNATSGHACPRCAATNGKAQHDLKERRDAALLAAAGIA